MTNIFTGKPKTIIPSPDLPNNPSSLEGAYDQMYTLKNMSFSGADAVATLVIPTIGEDGKITSDGDIVELGELQTISYSIHRENSPIRTLGHVNPRGFIKGGRTIAGSLIFVVFNEYAFYRIKQYREFLAKRNGFFAPLADMLPPFDIVISLFNEYGQYAKMKIFGVTIVDEGQTLSIEDLFTEQTYTFMARGIQPLVKITRDEDSDSTKDQRVIERDLQISRNIFGDIVTEEYAQLLDINAEVSEEYNANMTDYITRL